MSSTLQGIDALSERQKEVLRLTAGHHQVKEIARLLKISENTVKTHMIEVRRRLGGVTTKQAVRLLLAQEEIAPLILEGGAPKEVIPSAADVMPVWFHEHAPYPHRRINDPELQTPGDHLAEVGSTQPRQKNPGNGRGAQVSEPDSWTERSDLPIGRADGLVGGRWGEFRRRLKDLPAIQLLGLIVIAAIALALVAGMLVAALLGMVEVVHKLTFYAGWKT
ncbi:helix-turn-helix domain-containing protein [Asticcacaulis taihuensis]|uniref:LuxR C-terminal-related transcriptional regulator n=1 Tax=Asticcacaulis taihuensis TaxID=260084 RepID=UPI0026EB2795|nr:helix-turn-helix transcriptional regulator [Asticcacaulis taihuensis]